MQNPETGELVPIPDDNPENAFPNWETYEVGQRVKFNGWWWEVTEIGFMRADGDGRLTVRPVKKAVGRGKFGQRHEMDELQAALENHRRKP